MAISMRVTFSGTASVMSGTAFAITSAGAEFPSTSRHNCVKESKIRENCDFCFSDSCGNDCNDSMDCGFTVHGVGGWFAGSNEQIGSAGTDQHGDGCRHNGCNAAAQGISKERLDLIFRLPIAKQNSSCSNPRRRAGVLTAKQQQQSPTNKFVGRTPHYAIHGFSS